LHALISLEVVAMLDSSGLGRSALIFDACRALGMTYEQVVRRCHVVNVGAGAKGNSKSKAYFAFDAIGGQ
jgi:hypothetical protein